MHIKHGVPSETSVSCGVVALDTENPPLSSIDASSSDSSESVMAIARAVVFTSTWSQNGITLLLSKSFWKEINTFIQQRCIKLIKSDSKDI